MESSKTNISGVRLSAVHVQATLILPYTELSATSTGVSLYVMNLFLIFGVLGWTVEEEVEVEVEVEEKEVGDICALSTIGANTASSVECWLNRHRSTLGVDILAKALDKARMPLLGVSCGCSVIVLL